MASIDSVTASFAASLALAGGGGALDLGKIAGEPVRKSSQSYLLGKILTSKLCGLSSVKSHFQRIWDLEKKMKIQEKGEFFLFSFEDVRDKKKVRRGGAWSFDKIPMVLEDFDGIVSLTKVPMRHVRYWVKIEEIPPAYEEPTNFKLIGDLLGGFLDYDKPLFRKGTVRIFIRHDISKPILLKRVLLFDPGVEPMLTFTYEHLVGHCKVCGLITHAGMKCALPASSVASTASSLTRLPGFGSSSFVPGSSFIFSSQIPRGLGTSVFQHVAPCPLPTKDRRTVVIRSLNEKSPEDLERAVVVLGKRSRVVGESSSPKKLKMALNIRHSSLEASALGFIASVGSGEAEDLPVKRKRGRPVGARNKKGKAEKKTALEPLRLTYPVSASVPPCPTATGKEKV